jgi:hypothetical protein
VWRLVARRACFHVGFLIDLFFYPEDRGHTLLWYTGWFSTDYMALLLQKIELFITTAVRTLNHIFCDADYNTVHGMSQSLPQFLLVKHAMIRLCTTYSNNDVWYISRICKYFKSWDSIFISNNILKCLWPVLFYPVKNNTVSLISLSCIYKREEFTEP